MARSTVDLAELFGPATAELQQPSSTADAACGIAPETRVMTLDGAIPVGYLAAGDRVITRSGLRRLTRIDVTEYAAICPCLISAAALGRDRPLKDVVLGPATRLHMRDRRASTLFGADRANVAARRLVNAEHVSMAPRPRRMRLCTLVFETPEIFYAEGLEIVSAS